MRISFVCMFRHGEGTMSGLLSLGDSPFPRSQGSVDFAEFATFAMFLTKNETAEASSFSYVVTNTYNSVFL